MSSPSERRCALRGARGGADTSSLCGGSDASSSDSETAKSTSTWFSPAQRRAGYGARRRNETYFRQVSVGPIAEEAAHLPEGGPSASGGVSYDSSELGEPAAFTDQLFAVLERTVQQLWNQKLWLLLELVVPVLFVVLIVILWAVWPPEGSKVEETYVSYDSVNEGMVRGDLYTDFFCYNKSMSPIVDLSPCSDDDTIQCNPFTGTSPFEPHQFCSMYPDVPLSLAAISYVSTVLRRQLAIIPTLDTIMVVQWAAQFDSEPLRKLVAPVMAGFSENTRFSALMSYGDLYFVGPRADELDALMKYMNESSRFFYHVNRGVYSTVDAAKSAAGGRQIWAIVEVRAMNAGELDVVLHFNNTALPRFGKTFDGSYPGGCEYDNAELYLASGFLTLQQLVSEYYLHAVQGVEVEMEQVFVPVGNPPFQRLPVLGAPRGVLPLIITLSFLYRVSQQAKRNVLEKELRIRESMLIMGMGQAALYVGDCIVQVAMLLVIDVVCVVVLRVTVVRKGDAIALLCIYIVFSLTTIPLSALISAFFSKARLAALMAPVIYFILTIPMFAAKNIRGATVLGFSVFSPSGFAAATGVFLNHEAGNGFQLSDFRSPLDNPTLAAIVGILVGDIFIYGVVAVYLDAVLPREWGTPKHLLFFIIDPIRYCCGGEPRKLEGDADGRDPDGVYESTDYDDDAVQFCGLRKEYKRGGKKFVAVNNLYWGLRRNHISVLLGHNGAGKTTVINMMTGMIEPDQGDCYVLGMSVRSDLGSVRKQIGYCPQHNILWPELTCREHLEFFAKIKGLKGWDLEDAVCRMLYETDLLEKMDQPAGQLSGGQKRKLSVAIAFVASSPIVFLDEPTAGMDVGARRHTWELLRRMSTTHTIMLTTHYMDEADLLGHRIGIMSQGRLKCSGSGMFLKSNLGAGYSITMSLLDGADVDAVHSLVLGMVGGSTVIGLNGSEVMYRLPTNSVRQFPELLDNLDQREEELGVRGYSLSATTLEEVFLRVSEDDILLLKSHDPLMMTTQELIDKQEDLVWNCEIVESRRSLWLSQFKASMLKRLLNALRDRRMQCFQLVCPMVCILIAMLLSLISLAGPANLPINADIYPERYTMDITACDAFLGPNATLDTFDVVHHTFPNALNLSWYEVDTFKTQDRIRVGGVACKDVEIGNITYLANNIVHLVNSSTLHQGAISLNAVYSALYTRLTGLAQRLTLTAGTMPRTSSEMVFEEATKTILMGVIIMIPFSFLPSTPVAWVVKERECKARHLQSVSGLRFFIYWLSNILFDTAAYLITMILVVVIFVIFGREEYVSGENFGGTFTLFLLYGLSSTTCAYALSFCFKEHSTAQIIVLAGSFVTGFLLVVIVYVLSLLPTTTSAAEKLRYFTRLVPSYCIGEGIINLAVLQQTQAVGLPNKLWDMDTLGWPCVYMAIEIPVFTMLTLFLDHPTWRTWLQRRRYSRNGAAKDYSDEDSDVEEERKRIYDLEEKGEHEDMVRVVDLRKVYPNGKVAVRNVTFGVKPGEVFGFLGTNGAGKTTTISILCQEIKATNGTAYICGYDVVDDSEEALQCIGYCPQFDATLDLLTVEEHLRLYAGIRGVASRQRDHVVGALLRMCELSLYRGSLSSQLSGGNRRKLSVALSLVGGPSVVFLDEPSAGMDPVARRGLWTAIQKVADNCAVVLTTHHLEEVEALAHRVAIMVDGTLRCIGDKTHLKNKYGTGFEMTVRVSKDKYCNRLRRWIEKHIPAAMLSERKGERFVYALPPDIALSGVFRSLQHSKGKLHVTDYSVSQTSIEQVFLKISGELDDENDGGASSGGK